MITYFGRVGNFGKVKDDLLGKKTWVLEILCECKILLPLSKNPISSFVVRGTTPKSLINTGQDSYSSNSKHIVGVAYVFMVFHPFSTKKLDISVVPFRMQSINQIHFNSKLIQ